MSTKIDRLLPQTANLWGNDELKMSLMQPVDFAHVPLTEYNPNVSFNNRMWCRGSKWKNVLAKT
jgi:hypothetical protein